MECGLKFRSNIGSFILLGVLMLSVVWLRWPTLGFNVWNVDEAIHAAVARTLLDGGILDQDAIDIRHPLTYYAVAVLFSVFGENNMWIVRLWVAAMIAVTAWLLFLSGRSIGKPKAGLSAAGLYSVFSTTAFYQCDAFAANTEWFVAFSACAAATVFLSSGPNPSNKRLLAIGALSSGAFLSKQPAILEMAAPLSVLIYWDGFESTQPELSFCK